MEGGQKISINLEAPLDTKSSDMLVSVNDVRFAHNRQKFQGHVLPTSLRYERDGWAAGWYVYDFKIGGGYIFSVNDNILNSKKTWLAANRSKINATPTYVLSFHTAQNDDDSGTPDDRDTLKQYADAVSNTIQFQAWFTDTVSINARECEEAEIDFMPIPTLSFNYAVDGVNYRNSIRFTPFKNTQSGVVFDGDDCFTTLNPDAQHSADLTMEFVDRGADGTVTAILNNNEVKWNWSDTVYIPKDLVDDEGNKYGKLAGLTNKVITWRLGTENLQYTNNKFVYNGVQHNPNSNLSIAFSIPVTYTVPFNKVYSSMKNISWSVQGTRNLFNNEDSDNPVNKYKISYSDSQASVDFHSIAALRSMHPGNESVVIDYLEKEAGVLFDGPDVSLVSEMSIKLDINDLRDSAGIVENITDLESIYTASRSINCTVPVLTVKAKNFKLPGASDTDTHNVTIQCYIKYEGVQYLDVGILDGRRCNAYVLTYPFACMSAKKRSEPLVVAGTATDSSCDVSVDGKNVPANNWNSYVDLNNVNNAQVSMQPHVACRDIVGRLVKFTGNIKSINGVGYGEDAQFTLDTYGINTNLVFSRYDSPMTWQSVSANEINTYAQCITDFSEVSGNAPILEGTKTTTDHGNTTTYKLQLYSSGKLVYTRSVTGVSGGTSTREYQPSEYWIKINGTDFRFEEYISHVNNIAATTVFERSIVVRRPSNNTYYVIPFTNVSMSYVGDISYNNMSIIVSISNVSEIYQIPGHVKCIIADKTTQPYYYLNNIPDKNDVYTSRYTNVALCGNKLITFSDRDDNTIENSNSDDIAHTVTRTDSNVANFPVKGYITLLDFDTEEYDIGIPITGVHDTIGSNVSIERLWFDTDLDTLYIRADNNYYSFIYTKTDYWLGIYNGATDHIDINNLNLFCFDIVDDDTGELLVNHNIDTVNFNDACLKVYLNRGNVYTGKVFFPNTINPDDLNNITVPLASNKIAAIYKHGNVENAFFPVTKYRNQEADSIYTNDTDALYGTCRGIAVFNALGRALENIPDGYITTILSPLCNYIVSPRIKDNSLYVYAGKTYTHNISWHPDVAQYSYVTSDGMSLIYARHNAFLNDNSTDISNISVSPKAVSALFSTDNTSMESDNKYYITDKTLIEPNSITFYDNKVHVTYKAAPGNIIMLDGSALDLGTSDMSIKQEADLVPVYLPKYNDNTTKYNFVLGETDVLTTKETKEIINTIGDKEKHWITSVVTGIDYSQDNPQVTLQFKEYHNNNSPVVKTVVFDNTLQYSEAFVNKDYSDDSQIVINSSVNGTAIIHLPDVPASNNFKYDTEGNIANIIDRQNSNNRFKYNYKTNTAEDMFIKGKQLARANVSLDDVDDYSAFSVYHISVNQNINSYVYFKHYGIYKIVAFTVDSTTPKIKELSYAQNNKRSITFKVSDFAMRVGAESTAVGINVPFTVNLNHFDDVTECTPKYLDYSATDVRDDNDDTKTKYFARVMADSEYQLVKQHWDSTVATENFWWIDPEHTMKLTKDRFIVEEKLAELDPWNGNKWQKVHEYERTDYLTSEADTCIYSSVSGRNAHCYLYILSPETETSIKVKIYNPLVSTEVVKDNRTVERMQLDSEFTISFKHVALGKQLNANTNFANNTFTLCTYSDILSTSLLADSKLSAVEINGTHYLGIQYDRNFNQWTIAFGNIVNIIHGYGCVGINGYATGGMLPVKYFTDGKFNDTVYDINKLEAEKDVTLSNLDNFNIFNERVVGDENQQWYISEELSDIVMSVSLKDGKIVKLPITNKYAQVYSSPSYVKYTVHALGIQIKQLVNLFGDDENPIWKEIIKYAMFPLVWYLSPYTNVINYLQQTLGQYAYVHYNSTSIGKQGSKEHSQITDDNAGLSDNESADHIDALISDDLSFDVQHIPQEQSFRDSTWDNVLGIFASMVVSATDYAMKDLTVNSLQNQSAVNDIGKKFSQAFLQNIGSMSVTGFNMQSTKPMLKSEVTAVKTLDMFYSTSAQQNCYAGPGYVNMQFVAQCTAQSVTSVQLEAQQTQMFMLLKQLTTWQGKATMFVLDLLKDFMFKMADVMGGGPSAGMVVGLGWIGATVTAGVGYALVAAKALVKLGLETVDSMLDSFFPSGIKSNVTAQLSRHNYDVEGKHAYGNKSECFMWPCADAKSKIYTDESVEAVLQDKSWPLEMPKATSGNTQFKPIYSNQPDNVTIVPGLLESEDWEGKVPYSIAMCKGLQKRRTLPDSTAFVIGTESFMPTVPFKNENIGEGEPVFTPPPVQDYIIDKNWNLFVTAMAGDALWVSCKDTKLFDGNYSNIVVTDSFCGVAAPHVAVEIKRDISEEYLRPWAVSPDAIALNITGLNCAYDEVAYHAFDGYGYRITDWLGSSGMNKEHYTLQYCFQINDRFKRSNKLPPNQFLGNFQAVPSMSLDVKDKVFNDIQVTTEERGMRTGVAGENKDTQRYSLPIFTEQISSLPAIVRALSPYKLAVVDGITSLTTDIRSSQSAYKIPDSVDFNINDKLYRMTNEYICSVDHEKGLEVVKYLVPALGLTYLGATPFMAYFYNQATRQYYIYQGGNTLQVMDMLERFRDIKSGTYDFINQEVVMPCLATMTRLDKKVKDDADETDNIVIPVFRHNKVGGELTPPTNVIFNTDSWYRTVSIPAGLTFQGPNRCVINRFVWSQYMLKDIKDNKGKWIKVPREEYHPFRKYGKKFNSIAERVHEPGVVRGWTHNPFLLVTSPLGVQEEVDCKFEWEITFAWTVEMEQLYVDNEYVTVNVMAETITPGGKVFNRPTHIYLHKELFTRSGNFGYYSFRYQGNNGIGNRERLHIWSDGYIAISSLQLEYKTMTEKRNEVLVIQEDLKGMKEM